MDDSCFQGHDESRERPSRAQIVNYRLPAGRLYFLVFETPAGRDRSRLAIPQPGDDDRGRQILIIRRLGHIPPGGLCSSAALSNARNDVIAVRKSASGGQATK
jgi:hypothetical protein